jgi:hypothetical protein
MTSCGRVIVFDSFVPRGDGEGMTFANDGLDRSPRQVLRGDARHPGEHPRHPVADAVCLLPATPGSDNCLVRLTDVVRNGKRVVAVGYASAEGSG